MRRTLDWFLSDDKAKEKEVKLIHADQGLDVLYFKECYIL